MIAATQPIIEGARNKKNKNKNKNKNKKKDTKAKKALSKYKGSEQCFINYQMDDILTSKKRMDRLFQCLNNV
jgi:hypothetical protein